MDIDFRACFDASPSAYLILDRDLLIRWANPAYLRATGQRLDAILGRHVFDVFPEPEGERVVRASFERVIATGRPDTLPVQRYPIPRGDGTMELRFWSPVNSPVMIGGEVRFVLHRVEDVSDIAGADAAQLAYELYARGRELAEANAALLRSEAALRDYNAFAAHDLRAPLRRARQAIADGATREAWAEIVRAEQLVRDMLALADVGSRALTLAPVDMAALARAAVWDAVSIEHGRCIEVLVGEMPEARGDEGLLGQVWANLIGNAVKFSRPRTVAFIEIGHDGGSYFVRDNGRGLAASQLDRIWAPFVRLATEVEGTGIGLSICQRVIERHGGRVWAEGEVGKGATFRFALPA